MRNERVRRGRVFTGGGTACAKTIKSKGSVAPKSPEEERQRGRQQAEAGQPREKSS